MISRTRSVVVRRGIAVGKRPQSAAVILMLVDRDASIVEHVHAPTATCHVSSEA